MSNAADTVDLMTPTEFFGADSDQVNRDGDNMHIGTIGHEDRHLSDLATRRYSSFTSLTDDDRAALTKLAGAPRQVKRRSFVTHEGDRDHGCFLLLEGWTASTVSFSNGARAIVKVHMPGDMLGTPSLALERSADSIMALTSCVVLPLSLENVGRMFASNPRLAAILFLIAQEERVMLMDRLAVAGRSEALSQVAFLLLQLHARAIRCDPTNEHGFDLPLSQNDFADLAGLTSVHVNRVLRKLRTSGAASWTRGRVNIYDQAKLRQIAGLPHRTLVKDPKWLPPVTSAKSADR